MEHVEDIQYIVKQAFPSNISDSLTMALSEHAPQLVTSNTYSFDFDSSGMPSFKCTKTERPNGAVTVEIRNKDTATVLAKETSRPITSDARAARLLLRVLIVALVHHSTQSERQKNS